MFKPKFEVRDEKAETSLREIGTRVGSALPPGYGFALLVFDYAGSNMFYTSSAERAGVIAAMREFIAKHEEN